MNEHSVKVERYWSIASHYTIGDRYDTLGLALLQSERRLTQIRQMNESKGTLIPMRVVIDERLADSTGDRPVRRYTLEVADL